MNAALEAVIAKIAKLRALAQSSNVHEASNAAAAAEKLLQEHRLSEADVGGSDAGSVDERASEDEGSLWAGASMPTWQWQLAGCLAEMYGVAVWFARRRSGTKIAQQLKMVGRRTDVEILRYQFAYLTVEIERLTQVWSKAGGFDRDAIRIQRNSFRIGAVQGVIGAMTEAKRSAEGESRASGSSASMVLVDRLDESKALLRELHKDLHAGRQRSVRGSTAAFSAGQEAGRSIHRGEALSGAGSHRVLGTGR